MVNVGDNRNVTKVFALFNWQIFKVCLGLGHENYFPNEASRYQALPLSNDLGITEANDSAARGYSTFERAYGLITVFLRHYQSDNSARLLAAMPASVEFVATGLDGPKPATTKSMPGANFAR